MTVLGYVRRSTDKQAMSAEVQEQQLTDAADLLGWGELELRTEEAASGGSMKNRPALAQALADLKAGRADVLAVTKMDRLSRSVADFSALLNTADREGWHVICMDLNVDTRTITGRAMAQMTAVFAEMERRRIGERTREGMAFIKATTGKHMGRPSHIPPEAIARMVELHHAGWSASAIAARFNDESVSKGPAATSAIWGNKQVTAALRRQGALLPWDEFVSRRRQRMETVVAQG